MKNHTSQKGNMLLSLLIGVVLIGLIGLSIWYFYSSSKKQTQTEKKQDVQTTITSVPSINSQSIESNKLSEKTQIYTSKNLEISFQIPQGYSVEEKFNDIYLTNGKYMITISSHGSSFNTAQEHVNNLEKQNKSNFSEKTVYDGNPNYSFLKTTKTDPNDKTKVRVTYFGVSNNSVVLIYSSNPEIYPTLEEIVNSFKFM